MYYNDEQTDRPSDGSERADASADAGDVADTFGHIAAAPEAESTAPPAKADLTSSFLAEISRAMRAAAVQERERIAGTVVETVAAHEQKVRDRGATEATELRRLADEDVAGIQASAEEAIEAIRTAADRNVIERRRSLAEYLDRHAALVETEIGRVNGAVDDYNAQLDGFFGRLAEEQNPAEIARLAGQLPEPPNLDDVGAQARADAVAEIAAEPGESERADETGPDGDAGGDVVGVMDTEAGTPVFDDAAAAAEDAAEPQPEPVPAGAVGEDEQPAAEAPTSNGLSAAALLRNLAPWTNPDRSSSSDNGPH